MKRHVSRMLAGSLLALSMTGALAVDEKRAAEISAQRCSICHGKEGESASPIYPRLAGQNAEYIARQLAEMRQQHRDLGGRHGRLARDPVRAAPGQGRPAAGE